MSQINDFPLTRDGEQMPVCVSVCVPQKKLGEPHHQPIDEVSICKHTNTPPSSEEFSPITLNVKTPFKVFCNITGRKTTVYHKKLFDPCVTPDL